MFEAYITVYGIVFLLMALIERQTSICIHKDSY